MNEKIEEEIIELDRLAQLAYREAKLCKQMGSDQNYERYMREFKQLCHRKDELLLEADEGRLMDEDHYQTGDTFYTRQGYYKVRCNDGWYEIREGDKLPLHRKTGKRLTSQNINILNPKFMSRMRPVEIIHTKSFVEELQAL